MEVLNVDAAIAVCWFMKRNAVLVGSLWTGTHGLCSGNLRFLIELLSQWERN